MTTIYSISEQILRLLNGNPVISGRVKLQEIKRIVCQVANTELKTETFAVLMANGETVPPNLMLATYESVPVVQYKNVSKSILPASPVLLPRNMGVFHISKTDDIDNPFIPIPSGLYGIIKPQRLLGEVNGLTSYQVFGNEVVYNKDLTQTGVTNVFMRLAVTDIDKLGDYDVLPIPADMQSKIIQAVYNLFVQLPPADKTINN